jgi:hypothetical protein
MRIPQLLYTAQQQVAKARIVAKKEVDADSLAHLEAIINAAQPSSPEDLAQQRLIKGLYSEDKNAFMRFVKGKKFESVLLWTESRAIISYLGLKGVVYIRWDNDEKIYRVSEFVKPAVAPVVAALPNE